MDVFSQSMMNNNFTLEKLDIPTALSTIDTRSMEVGQKAAELLIQKITNPDTPVQQITLKPELIVRESTLLK